MLPDHLKIVAILTVGFALATAFGYLSARLKLSPILGYLLAGYIIGPYSPGFVADLSVSEQLAEVGVILMMFGVGLHLNVQRLFKIKYIAIVGALGQTIFSSVIGALGLWQAGWPAPASIVIGLSLGIASTVLLLRILHDFNLQNTQSGHIALGWLLTEDLIAVLLLLILPVIATMGAEPADFGPKLFTSLSLMVLKFGLWVAFMFTLGPKIIAYILRKIVKSQSNELFSLAVLAITFVIAVGSALLTGASIAMGSFIAGILIGQTTLRRQVSVNVMPIKDLFMVIFFLSIGMLFDPLVIFDNISLLGGIVAIILIGKPLAALVIMRLFRYPWHTSVIVALALAQIGEFSLILAEEASKLHILPDKGYDLIVAGTIISFMLNPLLFSMLKRFSLVIKS